MKDESVSALLESGEIQMTDDVLFMVASIIEMFERGMNSDTGGQFIHYAMNLLEAWATSLETNSGKLDIAEEVIANIVAGKTA